MNLVKKSKVGDKEIKLISAHCQALKKDYPVVVCGHDVCDKQDSPQEQQLLTLEINGRRADLAAGMTGREGVERKVIVEAESCENGKPDYAQIKDICIGAMNEGIEFHLVLSVNDFQRYWLQIEKICPKVKPYIYKI